MQWIDLVLDANLLVSYLARNVFFVFLGWNDVKVVIIIYGIGLKLRQIIALRRLFLIQENLTSRYLFNMLKVHFPKLISIFNYIFFMVVQPFVEEVAVDAFVALNLNMFF